MAAGSNRSPSHVALLKDEQFGLSYQSWKARRPQLFHKPSPASPSMAPNTVTPIAVLADGQSQIISLPRTTRDESLQSSLISKARAHNTKGHVNTRHSTTTFIDQYGRSHISNSTITLRWYYENGIQTYQETFHIVEHLVRTSSGNENGSGHGEWDAILRKDIELGPGRLMPQIHTLCYSPGTKGSSSGSGGGGGSSSSSKEQQRKDDAKRASEKYQAEKRAQQNSVQNTLARIAAAKKPTRP